MFLSKQHVLFVNLVDLINSLFFSLDLQLWVKSVAHLTSEEKRFPTLPTGINAPLRITLQRSTFIVPSRTNAFFWIVYKHPTLFRFTDTSNTI